MSLKIALESTGSDRGALVVRGLPEAWSEVLAAVQRMDDNRYLTVHRRWDLAPCWHPCARLGAGAGAGGGDGAARFEAGPILTAGILAAGGTPLRVQLRRGDFSDAGPLEVPDRHPPRADSADPPQRDLVPVGPVQEVGDWAPVGASAPTPLGNGSGEGRARSVPSWATWRLALAVFSVMGIGGLIWAYLTPPTVGPTPVEVTGKALYRDLKRQGLPAADLLDQAERADQAGDCEAAIRLYIDAAQADARVAERLGRRYDPEGFRPAGCFVEPKPDSALVWYQSAAERNIPQAQRRYGELLLGEADGGPVYQEALDWLRKAAAAGDELAQRRLAALAEH
ncbi:MAG TPA: hypothetical protein VES73_13955 [Lamprocystis sp. (in: g-proteobacteria)]|nr:hypothetical protein [Lamprocystis sp. (in: g-proteobacteria)]